MHRMNVRIALEKWHFAMALHLPGRVGNLEFLPLIYSNGPKNRRKKTLRFVQDIHYTFLSKIQNRTSEKTEKKILLLSCKKLVKTQFLGVVVFPSNFWFQNIKVVVFPSNFLFQNFKVVVFPSNFWKTTMIWQFFTLILNFSQECYYLKNKVGVVDFANAQGLVMF